MKRKNFIICITLSICMLFCVACGKESPENKSLTENTNEISDIKQSENTEENTNEVEVKRIEVSTSQELLEAIGPNVIISIQPGYYNLSEYIEELWISEEEAWNMSHPYVRLRECFDGVEIVVQNACNLTIMSEAQKPSDTEIVVEPRYAAVLNFLNCDNLSLSALTMGHTEYASCEGNVLNFYGCQQVDMKDMDLYGCGVYGIATNHGSGEITVSNSTIRECAYGPLDLMDCEGNILFENCNFVGSDGGGYYDENGKSELVFSNCTFGEWETNMWYFYEGIITRDCEWSEISEYPEYDWVE